MKWANRKTEIHNEVKGTQHTLYFLYIQRVYLIEDLPLSKSDNYEKCTLKMQSKAPDNYEKWTLALWWMEKKTWWYYYLYYTE